MESHEGEPMPNLQSIEGDSLPNTNVSTTLVVFDMDKDKAEEKEKEKEKGKEKGKIKGSRRERRMEKKKAKEKERAEQNENRAPPPSPGPIRATSELSLVQFRDKRSLPLKASESQLARVSTSPDFAVVPFNEKKEYVNPLAQQQKVQPYMKSHKIKNVCERSAGDLAPVGAHVQCLLLVDWPPSDPKRYKGFPSSALYYLFSILCGVRLI